VFKSVPEVVVEQHNRNNLIALEETAVMVPQSPELIIKEPPIERVSIKDKILSQIKVFRK
jgi:hypothetical protein